MNRPFALMASGLLLLAASDASAQDVSADVEADVGANADERTDLDRLGGGDIEEARFGGAYDIEDEIGCDLDDSVACIEVGSAVTIAGWNNRDLLELDETTVQDIINSDDRTFAGEFDLVLGAAWRPEERVTLRSGVFLSQAMRDSANQRRFDGGNAQIIEASISYHAVDTENVALDFTAGRHDFDIGSAPNDYIMAGAVDGISARLDLAKIGELKWLAFEIYSANEIVETGFEYVKPGLEPVNRFNGETNTYRTGIVYENTELVDDLSFALYFLHATIAGSGPENTGADVTLGGLTGNFRDRDYLRNYGLRVDYDAAYDMGLLLEVNAEFAMSSGVDRKAPEYVDVDLGGMMFGGGLGIGYDFGRGEVDLETDFYRFDGASYSSTGGLQFEGGFTSMRGDRIGGVAVGRMASWRPSGVLTAAGIDHSPHDWDRQAGTQFLRAGLGFEFDGFEIDVDFFTYTDTSESLFDQSTLDETTPPIGFSREEIAAQRRAGLNLGQEISIEVEQRFSRYASLIGGFGLFMPGEYYDIEIDRVAAFNDARPAIGGEGVASFWAFHAGLDFFGGYAWSRGN